MLNEIFHEITPITLHHEDLNCMYNSIENRSPFLDKELFALLLTKRTVPFPIQLYNINLIVNKIII